jgi:transcriptional regulator with XRE-family HTH domain
MAQEWQQALDSGEHRTQAEIARRQGISRARVSQVLRFLNLAPDVLHTITALGDPLPSQVLTERMLRSILERSPEEQRQEIWRTLTERCPMTDSPI